MLAICAKHNSQHKLIEDSTDHHTVVVTGYFYRALHTRFSRASKLAISGRPERARAGPKESSVITGTGSINKAQASLSPLTKLGLSL